MSTCHLCGKERIGAATCADTYILIDGCAYAPVPYAPRANPGGGDVPRCPDCNVAAGGYHHVACGLERCPRCGGWWIHCRCQGRKVPAAELEGESCRVLPFAAGRGKTAGRR